jgi:dTDP-glucose 4,6-dehydratase
VDKRLGRQQGESRSRLIRHVPDRPGHDRRYAIDASKIRHQLGWAPAHRFEEALELTVDWYLGHKGWVDSVRTGEYRQWIRQNYEEREIKA